MRNEDFNLLTEYKEHLHTALHSDYARYVPRKVLQRMTEIIRGENANYRMNASCPRCVLTILKDAARLYEREKRMHENSTNHGGEEEREAKAPAQDYKRGGARDAGKKHRGKART